MIKTFKTFFKFSTQKRAVFACFVVAMIVGNILANITPYFYKLFIDSLPSNNLNHLLLILCEYSLVQITALLVIVCSHWLGDLNVIDAATNVRAAIFRQVQDLDFAFHSNKSTGGLISIFKRGDAAFFNFFDTLYHKMFEVVIGLFVMIYFFYKLDVRITIAAFGSIFVTLIATRFLVKNNLKKRIKFNNEEDNVSAVITDNMINYETVKLFAKEAHEQDRLQNSFIPWKTALWDFANSFRLVDLTIGSITYLGVFAIFAVSLANISSGKINVGDFVLVAAFINNFIPRVWELTWNFKDISKNYADIEKYFELLDYEIEVKDPEKPIDIDHVRGVIEFKNVHFNYNGRTKNAINGINLKIEKGQSVALVGRSGSGKTTMAKLLMRFYDINSGEITIDGINITNFSKSTLRSFVGVVPQEPILFNNTIAYNIGYGSEGDRGSTLSEIKKAAKVANIDNFIEKLKEKYDTEVGERGVKLSGGQKQRLAIARMILSDPDIVVFDEATSHLDSESEKLIQDAFWKARNGKTTIIIAHRLSTIMRADKIIVMEHGKIKEVGTHVSLLENKESLYSHFWNLQIKLE